MKEINCDILKLQYLLGKKWTLPLLFEFQNNKQLSFNQLKKMTKDRLNSTLLSNTLKELEEFKILKKKLDKKQFYILTNKGQDLISILNKLKDWSIKNSLGIFDNCKKQSCIHCNKFLVCSEIKIA
tara:strand:+ start:153 stop:530 length:378 start_codon:yes stop_codon:yes gene_type:complete